MTKAIINIRIIVKNILRQVLLYLLVQDEGLVLFFFHCVLLAQACSLVEKGVPIPMIFNYSVHFLLQLHLNSFSFSFGLELLSLFDFK